METTVAAPQMPFLRESVNAVPGAGCAQAPVEVAAKVGNATQHSVDESAYGDWAHLPEEAQATPDSVGGVTTSAARGHGFAQSHIAHDGTGL
jgi:hypothetical protein